MNDPEVWIPLMNLVDLKKEEMEAIEIGDHKIVVFHLKDGSVHITKNVCTHEFALLSEGWFEGCEVECPLHAGRFDVRSGKAMNSPLTEDLKTYPSKVENGVVHVLLSSY